jgi:hypothetical protein
VDLKIDISMLEFMFDATRMLTNMVFTGALVAARAGYVTDPVSSAS